ncbi:MAG: hypothetical protein V3S62_03005, partial [Acidimicrobiia bacterium]
MFFVGDEDAASGVIWPISARQTLLVGASVKGLAGYLGYRVFSGLFGLLPEPVMRRIGFGLGWGFSFLARHRFAMVMRHQTRVQGSGIDARRAARRAFGFYGR